MPNLGGPRKSYGFSPCLCLPYDIVGRWTVWSASSHVLAVRDVFTFVLGSGAFSRSFRCDDSFDTNGPVGNRTESSVAIGAVVCRGLDGDVPGGVVSIIHRPIRCGGGWEILPVTACLVWDVCSCNDKSCGLDLIVQFGKCYGVLPSSRSSCHLLQLALHSLEGVS